MQVKVNQLNSPMFLSTRNEFKEYLSKYKNLLWLIFIKLLEQN